MYSDNDINRGWRVIICDYYVTLPQLYSYVFGISFRSVLTNPVTKFERQFWLLSDRILKSSARLADN